MSRTGGTQSRSLSSRRLSRSCSSPSALPGGAQSLLELAGRPAAVSLAGALLSFACAVLVARLVVTRRALDHRVAMLAVPADSFDPSPESVVRFASGLSRSRRAIRGLLDAPASAVRLRLDADPAGKLRYGVEVPAHARGALRAAIAAYHGVELRPVPEPSGNVTMRRPSPTIWRSPAPSWCLPGRAASRCERPASIPIRSRGSRARSTPSTPAAVTRRRSASTCCPSRRGSVGACGGGCFAAPAASPRPSPGDELADLLGAGDRRRGGAPPAELVERWVGRQALTRKLGTAEPLFEMQVLVRVASPVPGRAKAQLAGMLADLRRLRGREPPARLGPPRPRRRLPRLGPAGPPPPVRPAPRLRAVPPAAAAARDGERDRRAA